MSDPTATTYDSHAHHVEPGQTATFFDLALPDDLFGVPVPVRRVENAGTRCRITTSGGRSFEVLAIAPVKIEG